MAFGYTFAPTTDNAQQGRLGGSPPGRTQDAIRTLHFELPRVSGAQIAGSISPLAGGERAGSSVGDAVLQSVLKTVLGADAASALVAGSPARQSLQGAPTTRAPRVTGGGTGGVTVTPQELPTGKIPNFGRPPNPTVLPREDGDEGFTGTPNPDEVDRGGRQFLDDTYRDSLDREARLNGRSPLGRAKYDEDTAAPAAPDFRAPADSFADALGRERELNGRAPIFYRKFED